MSDFLLRNIADDSMQIVTGATPLDVSSLVASGEYAVRAISPEATTTLAVSGATGGFDFTQTPYAAPTADTSVTALGGGDWQLSVYNNNAGANIGWNIGTFVPAGASGEWSFTLESSVDILTGELEAIRGGNSSLTVIRGLQEDIVLSAGVPQDFIFGFGGSDEVRYHGFKFYGPAKGSWNLKIVNSSLVVV